MLLVVIAPLAAIALAAWTWDLKYVELDGDKLLVSGVRHCIVISLSEVAVIRQSVLEPWRSIYVGLKTPGPFGEGFSFVPASVYAWDTPSVVERLRGLAGLHGEGP
jgi:hypothetical protein